jgi:uncharacterized protein YdeI (YjbR/CyaY-like superfamily)
MRKPDKNAAKPTRNAGKKVRPSAVIPTELKAALEDAPIARRCFEQLPPSHQKAYTDWVGGAKRPETRTERSKKSIERLLEKPRTK